MAAISKGMKVVVGILSFLSSFFLKKTSFIRYIDD